MKALKRMFKRCDSPTLRRLAYAAAGDALRRDAHSRANDALCEAAAMVASTATDLDPSLVRDFADRILRGPAPDPTRLSGAEYQMTHFFNLRLPAIQRVAAEFLQGRQLGDDDVRAIVDTSKTDEPPPS